MSKNQNNDQEMIKDSSVTLKVVKEDVKTLKDQMAAHEERIKALEANKS